jgi:NADH-quinone oxidoreductase subunit N
MVVGNVIALAQRNVKRMLAYSSIAHAGYLLVPIVTNAPGGTASLLFYLAAYSLATIGAFAVVSAVSDEEGGAPLTDFAGLYRSRPGLAVAMAVCLLALLGFPLAGGAGFFAKYFVILAARQAGQTYLSIVLVVTSVISAGYYLAVVAQMFMRRRADDAPALRSLPRASAWLAYGAAALLLVLGVYPTPLLDWARESVPVSVRPAAIAGSSTRTSRSRRRRRWGTATRRTCARRASRARWRSAATTGRAGRCCATRWSARSPSAA